MRTFRVAIVSGDRKGWVLQSRENNSEGWRAVVFYNTYTEAWKALLQADHHELEALNSDGSGGTTP